MSQKIPNEPFRFGLFMTRPHLKWAISAVCFVFVATGFARLSVLVLRYLTDAITAQPLQFDAVWFWAIAYPVVFFLAENSWRGSGFTGMRWFMYSYSTAYQSLYEYLTLHSKDYFSNRFAGALTNKIANAVDGTQVLFQSLLWRFTPTVLGLIWFIIFTWMSNVWLGFLMWIWSVIFIGLNIWFAKKLEPHSFTFAQSLSTLKGSVVDSLSNISLVHEHAYVAGERSYIKQFITRASNAGLKRWYISEWVLVANGLLLALFSALMILTSVYLFQQGSVSVGVVIMVIAIIAKMTDTLLFFGQDMRDAAKYYGEAKEGLQEILHPHTIVDKPTAQDVKITKGDIAIDAIDFQYEKQSVFQNFSLHIPAGQKVGLVGRSGAGKTTFVSLLLRHFEIEQGRILIDGNNIYDITLDSLRRAIAFVPQDTSLFHRSVKEDLRYSNPRATDAQVKRQAKLAHADEFIQELPNGYSTLVGERGVKLSGGQRQRIAIARAFLKNSPILMLDEATSALDSASEQAIQESLNILMKNRTVIAIAHRLSTLKKMDRIVVIENGKIIEDGAPNMLMKKKDGIFKRMWDHQVKGFIVDE